MNSFDMTIPADIAQKLEPLHPEGAQHATAAALRLYLGLGKLGVDALNARAKHEGMGPAELILHLLAVVETPAPNEDATPTTMTPRSRRLANHARDMQIAEDYFAGGTTHARLAAKYGLSTIRVSQIVAKAKAVRNP